MAERNDSSSTQGREITSERIVNAPRELVWKVMSDPNHLKNWWGPAGFTNTFNTHEFKPGGAWSFVMHGPDGTNYKNEITYGEIVKPSRIVLEHTSGPCFRLTMTLSEVDGGKRTRVHWHAVFRTEKEYNGVKDFAIIGNEGNFDRLEAELAPLTGTALPKEFLLERTFRASKATLWKMWTQPEHMARWWGPKELKVGQSKMDFRRGGTYHYSMIGPDGTEMWGKMYYRDIVEPVRVLWVNTFSDKNGGLTRHPMAPQFPAEMLSMVTLDDAGAGQTKVTIRWYPINATPEEIAFFNGMHDGMNQGWTGSFDRLEEILKTEAR